MQLAQNVVLSLEDQRASAPTIAHAMRVAEALVAGDPHIPPCTELSAAERQCYDADQGALVVNHARRLFSENPTGTTGRRGRGFLDEACTPLTAPQPVCCVPVVLKVLFRPGIVLHEQRRGSGNGSEMFLDDGV